MEIPNWLTGRRRTVHLLLAAAVVLDTGALATRLLPETVTAWDRYAAGVERRRATEKPSADRFLVMDFQPTGAADRRAVLGGAVVAKRFDRARSGAADVDIPSGRVHHWRGAVLIPGVTASDLIARIEHADPPAIADDVLTSKVISRAPGEAKVYLRLQRTKIVTVVYNSEHVVRFEPLSPTRAASTSASTKIAEIRNPGTRTEAELPLGNDSGYLWRLNGYWRYETAPGGVIAECESISLSRDVPFLLDYVAGGIIEGAARESMERTLAALKTRFQVR